MKIVIRSSDGKVMSVHSDDADMSRVGRGPGEKVEEVAESFDAFVRRAGDYGEAFFDGASVVPRPPIERPATLAGEIRRARQANNQRLEGPVSLVELEAAEAAFRERGQP